MTNTSTNLPPKLAIGAFRFLWREFSTFLHCALIPIFVALLWHLASLFLPLNFSMLIAIKYTVMYFFMGYFGVRWLTYVMEKNRSILPLAPVKFTKKEAQYAVILFFLTLIIFATNLLLGKILFSVIAPLIGTFFMLVFAVFVQVFITAFFAARFKFLLVDVSLGRPLNAPMVWRKTRAIWPRLMGSLILVWLFAILIFAPLILIVLLFSDVASTVPSAEFYFHVLTRYAWIQDILQYFVAALELYVIAHYYKAVS